MRYTDGSPVRVWACLLLAFLCGMIAAEFLGGCKPPSAPPLPPAERVIYIDI